MLREKIFEYLNSVLKLIEILPDDKKEMLEYSGLIYQKYVSRLDVLLSFIFGVDVFHLVWEYPNGERYYEYDTKKKVEKEM
jgi:hypothetical protein